MNKNVKTRIILVFAAILLCLYIVFIFMINHEKTIIYKGMYTKEGTEVSATLELKIKWYKLKLLNKTDLQLTITDETGKVLEKMLDPAKKVLVFVLKDRAPEDVEYYHTSSYALFQKRTDPDPLSISLNKNGSKIDVKTESLYSRNDFHFTSQ